MNENPHVSLLVCCCFPELLGVDEKDLETLTFTETSTKQSEKFAATVQAAPSFETVATSDDEIVVISEVETKTDGDQAMVVKKEASVCSAANDTQMSLRKQRTSALLLQRFLKTAINIKRETQAAIKVESAWRMSRAQKKARARAGTDMERDGGKNSRVVLKIQSAWRRCLAKTNYQIAVENSQAAVNIQSVWRMYLARKNLIAKVECARLLQRLWRRVSLRKTESKRESEAQDTNDQFDPFTGIQDAWRMFLALRQNSELETSERKQAAIKIQTVWRMQLTMKKRKDAIKSVRSLQQMWRHRLSQRKTPPVNVKQQTAFTGSWQVLTRKNIENGSQVRSGIAGSQKLQRVGRQHLVATFQAQVNFKTALDRQIQRNRAVAVLQAWVRLKLWQRRLLYCKSAVTIQRQWRAYDTKRTKHSVRIQKRFRLWSGRQDAAAGRRRQGRAAKVVQQAVRLHFLQPRKLAFLTKNKKLQDDETVVAANCIQKRFKIFKMQKLMTTRTNTTPPVQVVFREVLHGESPSSPDETDISKQGGVISEANALSVDLSKVEAEGQGYSCITVTDDTSDSRSIGLQDGYKAIASKQRSCRLTVLAVVLLATGTFIIFSQADQSICSPVRPSKAELGPGVYESPWWVPVEDFKGPVYNAICSNERPPTRLVVTEHSNGKLRFQIETGSTIVAKAKNLVSLRFRSNELELRSKRSKKTLQAPWN